MAARKKLVTLLVTVTVPQTMTPAEARREVRELISHQCNYAADLGDVIAKRVSAAPKG